METGLRPLAALLAVVMVTAGVIGPALLASSTASAATSTSSSCEQSVTHDKFRTTAAIDAVNTTGEATSSLSNTEVRVKDATGFVRLHADNPNGYCVSYTVEISPEIVSPADLGQIKSNDEGTEASWRAAQNLTSGEVYTRVKFTLEAGENATFAPSSVRVQSLSWTGTAKQESQGVLSSVRSLFGSDKLEQRTYEIQPTKNSSRITVPLESGDGEEIEDWHATYTIGEKTRPVEQDARDPVYYTESGSSVTFHFSERADQDGATVTFTAEPTFVERTRFSADAYLSGLSEGESWLPFTTIVPTEVIA